MAEGDAPVGAVGEVLKAAAEALHLSSEKQEKSATRGGPLLMMGRLYVSLTLILAAVTSASAYLDEGREPTTTVVFLRWAVLGCVALGLALGILLIFVLHRRHPLFLFSPTELSPATQQDLLLPRIKEEKTVPAPKGT